MGPARKSGINKKWRVILLLLLVLVSCREENKPPACAILHPNNKSVFEIGDSIHVEVFASDPEEGPLQVEISLNGTRLVTLDQEPFTYGLPVEGYQPGEYTLNAEASDEGGLSDADAITITFNTGTPVVKSVSVDSITTVTAVVKGEVVHERGATVTARGVCWNTLPNPTVSHQNVLSGSGTGPFECKLQNLLNLTSYYVRTYAENENGISYGEQLTFTTGGVTGRLPVVTTGKVSAITKNSAICGGDVSEEGLSPVTGRGSMLEHQPESNHPGQ